MIRAAKSLAVVVLLVLVAGCGGGAKDNGVSKLSPTAALAKTKSSLEAVTSMHVTGSITQNGKALAVDLHSGKGKGEGTMKVGGGTIELRLVDGNAYLRGEASALTAMGAPSAAVALMAGKWLKTSATTGEFSGFASLLDIDKFASDLLTPEGTPQRGKDTDVNGHKAFTLVDSKDSGTLYIAATGEPLPLRVEKSGTAGGHVDFSDYGAALDVSAPPGAVDLSKLGQ